MRTAEQAGRAWAARTRRLMARRVPLSPATVSRAPREAPAPATYGAVRIEARDDGPWIVGQAARFYRWSEPITAKGRTFREILAEGAFDEALASPGLDVAITIGHDPDQVVARYRGPNIRPTARVWADSDGLRFEFRVPDTDIGQRALRGVRTGELAATSFKYVPGKEQWKETRAGLVRHVLEVGRLVDVALVREGAYDVAA